ncbi:hypothetical protein [uncultured Brevundimonas sp.]|uniref:hypothetical protein n=1 Tax=uncultured Brevundimonas sp. TaxID=213418 RepID=UPI00262D1047|nr:hypothetical protein [uncultured Brevundimonas sp.]
MRNRTRLWMGAVAAVVSASAVAAPASASENVRQAYHDRTLILSANARCGYFNPAVAQALGAAALQTRGTLLRAGDELSSVQAIAVGARAEARAMSCRDAALQDKASRIIHAFERWERAARLQFPARNGGWRVDRYRSREAGWKLVQESRVGGSPVRFGLAGTDPAHVVPTAVVSFQGRSRPYAARIVMRDTAMLPQPHGVSQGRAAMPPAAGRVMVLASRKSRAERTLLPTGQRHGEAWVFAPEAIARLASLDPREPFWIEFLFGDDSIARVPFEAGDLAAAKAFLDLGPV